MNRRHFIKTGLIFVPSTLAVPRLFAQAFSPFDPVAANTASTAAPSCTTLRETLGTASGTTSNFGNTNTFCKASSHTAGASYTLCKLLININKTGTPTSDITAKIWANNAGVPGTELAASTNVINGANVTTSLANYEWTFADFAIVSGTVYWFGVSVPSANGSNFYRINLGNTSTGDIREGSCPPATFVSSRKAYMITYSA